MIEKRITSCVLCLMFVAVSLAVVPQPTKAGLATIEYQIGTKAIEEDGTVWAEYWSDWASDGDEAEVTYEDMSWPGIIAIRVSAPGYYVEYQIGTKAIEEDGTVWAEYWSDWASDGDEAEVTYEDMSWPGIIAIRVSAPGYYVEYQIGTKAIEEDGTVWAEYWSDWASDGDEAEVIYEDMSWPGIFSMRAMLTAPEVASVDMDPNTLNLKSKGMWVTGYIDPPENYNVGDININTVLLEDYIPIEWNTVESNTLMVKFDRSEIEDRLTPGTYNLKISGELNDGTLFEGYSDEIRVI